jgi:hypothetical protein
MPYTVIRSQNLPNVGDYQQGTFCIVDAYEPKKVYLNIGLWWIEIPQSDSLYGKVTRFDDVKLLYRVEDGGQRSAVGPDPNWSYSDRMYAEDGSYVGLNEPTDLNGDGRLWWSGPGYTNHITSNDITTWSKTGATITTDGDWYKVTESVLAEAHHVTSGITAAIGVSYTGSITIKPNGRNFAYVGLNGGGLAYFVSVDLITGALANVSGSPVFRSIRNNDGSITVYVSGVATSATSIVLDVRVAKDTNWASNRNYLGDGVSGISIQNPQLTTVFTAPYVPPLTTVNELTDYVPAIHGDKGVWCGPSYGNLLAVGSENLASTLWGGGLVDYELTNLRFGNSPVFKAESLSTGAYSLQTVATFPSSNATFSVKLKRGTAFNTDLLFWDATLRSNVVQIGFNWDTLNITIKSGSGTFGLVELDDGWYELSCTISGFTVGNSLRTYIYPNSSGGAGGFYCYITCPQLTATSAPMPYVPPGTTVASAAGTSGNNGIYFDMAEEPDGVELVYNGTFDSTTDGWTSVSYGILSVVDGKLHVSGNAGDGAYAASTTVSLIVGAKYRFTGVTIPTAASPEIRLGYYSAGSSQIASITSDGVNVHDFVAESSVLYITLYGMGDGLYSEWDNISVQRLSSPLMQCFEKSETDGVELVTNGTFDSDVSGWTVTNYGVQTVSDGLLTITNSDAYSGYVYQLLTLEVGKTYIFSVELLGGNPGSLNIRLGSTLSGGEYKNISQTGSGIITFSFTPTSASCYVRVGNLYGSTGNTVIIDNISVQKLKPATCTVAAEVTMGVGSGDLAGLGMSTWANILAPNTGSTWNSFLGHGYDNIYTTPVIVKDWDGTNGTNVAGFSWNRYERHIKLIQTNADGTQFRVGYKRIGINSAIQWSSWISFDGSFNTLTHLRLAYGNTVPIWFRRVMVSNKGGMSDTEIETRMVA